MKIRGSVVSLSLIFLHPPEDKKMKKNIVLAQNCPNLHRCALTSDAALQ